MTTTIDGPSDSSVTFSLAELVKLEQDRIQEERAREAHAAKMFAERGRAEAERTLAAEAARRAEEEEARRARALRDAEAIARIQGREHAMGEVARIEAEAKAHIDRENAARAHELVLLRERMDRRAVRGRGVLAGLLAVSVAGAAAVTLFGSARASRLETEVASLREKTFALEVQRDDARTDEGRARRAEREANEREAATRKAYDDALAAARASAPPAPSSTISGGKTDRGGPVPKDDRLPKDDGKKCVDPHDPLCGFGGRGI